MEDPAIYSDSSTNKPRCPSCGGYLPIYDKYVQSYGYWRGRKKKKKAVGWTYDNSDPQYGTRGDNLVCNQICAYTLLIRLLQAVPGTLDLLPPNWRYDQRPTTESPKLQKIAKNAKLARRPARR